MAEFLSEADKRTDYCGTLTKERVGAEVVVAVSIAVASTAEIFSSFIGKKSPSK